ncbi:MAG TPA: polysaccharide biosynthesis/export family protein [Pyrinomonadaceae bacterium]|nr:polysaccharide biosynthesis/export family protein [Pyrinomonadaceae bacterium]
MSFRSLVNAKSMSSFGWRFNFPNHSIAVAICIGFISCASGIEAYAQGNVATVATTDAAIPKSTGADTRYRIGPGDVLTITVRKTPELSGNVRVDQQGMIRLPMIDHAVTAACRTESELAAEIANLYLEYKNHPDVEVFVAEFQSRPVAVIGSVNAPGQFRLQRQVRLLELLTSAGGPSLAAGRIVNIIHTGSPIICQKESSDPQPSSTYEGLQMLKLNDTLNGKLEANPIILPGDIVQLPEADQVFVIGHVLQPRAVILKDKIVTVSWAIAMAGGVARDGKTNDIRIIRQTSTGAKQEILVDLRAIQKQQAVDLVLIPNDIVEVGTSASKTILGILQGAVPSAISQGVVRAIP